MVLLAVDNNGLTNELARFASSIFSYPLPQTNNSLCSLLVSSRFLTKLTKDPRKIMALDLSEGRVKSSLRLSIKDHLVAQLRRLYRDVDSASVRNSLPKILAEMEVLTLKVLTHYLPILSLVFTDLLCSLCCLHLWNSTTVYHLSIKTK